MKKLEPLPKYDIGDVVVTKTEWYQQDITNVFTITSILIEIMPNGTDIRYGTRESRWHIFESDIQRKAII